MKKTVAVLTSVLTALVFIPNPKQVSAMPDAPPTKMVVPHIASRSGEDLATTYVPPQPKKTNVVKIKPVAKTQPKPVYRKPQPLPETPSQPVVSGWMDFQATFYTLNEGSGTGLTKTGTVPTAGRTLAVDPSIIPLGTVVEIKYPDGHIERRVAEDTGGAIHGRILDVYVITDQEAIERGRQNVQLRIVYKS